MALPLALMALVVLGAVSAALLTIGGSEVQVASNFLRGTQAHFLAEAGLEDAFNWFRSDTSRISGAPSSLETITGLAGPGSTLSAYGSYGVKYRKAGDDTVFVEATGKIEIGGAEVAQKVLKAIISNGFLSKDAIRTNGDLEVSGTAPRVEGACGSAHTNEDFSVSGAARPTFEQGATATGTADSPATGGQPKKTMPTIRAADVLAVAKSKNPLTTFEMRTDGSVVDGNGTPVFTYVAPAGRGRPAVDTYRGWKWTPGPGGRPGSWSLTNSTLATGATYYFQQDVALRGAGTLLATILATGDITASGDINLTPHLTDTLLVADKDIDLGGNPGSTVQGLIAAHEQVELSGNVSITGYILAEDGATSSSTVTTNSLGGSVSVTYNCNMRPPIKGPVQFIAWGL